MLILILEIRIVNHGFCLCKSTKIFDFWGQWLWFAFEDQFKSSIDLLCGCNGWVGATLRGLKFPIFCYIFFLFVLLLIWVLFFVPPIDSYLVLYLFLFLWVSYYLGLIYAFFFVWLFFFCVIFTYYNIFRLSMKFWNGLVFSHKVLINFLWIIQWDVIELGLFVVLVPVLWYHEICYESLLVLL